MSGKPLKSDEINFFEQLYQDYYPRTLYFARQYLTDEEEACEVTQETFVALWEKRQEIRTDLNIQAFILTIAKNKCLNLLRKKITEHRYADELLSREAIANYAALADDSFDSIHLQELEKLIAEAIAELPEKTRLIYRMSRDQQISYEDIAREIHLSVKSVEYHMTKALAHLRYKLKDYLLLLFYYLFTFIT